MLSSSLCCSSLSLLFFKEEIYFVFSFIYLVSGIVKGFMSVSSVIKFLDQFLIIYFSAELEGSAVQMAEMYCQNLPLSKDLDPQESMHGEELLSMVCTVLIQVS